MRSIEERAKEYADRHKATEINYFGVGNVYGYERIYNAEITAYERGATEQKDIDIDKACEIVRNIANEYFGDWEQSCKVEDTFRKAMEE